MIKLTKRKGFNFFRSYYDVFNELDDKNKLQFIKALLDKQFLGINPTKLKGNANFAYISQMHSIDSQVKGYEDKTGAKLTPTAPPTVGGSLPPTAPPCLQVEEEEQVKEELLIPPPINLIKDYFSSKNISIEEAERFNNYYTSNGWKVGKNKMVNWHSSAGGWISRLDKGKKKPYVQIIK